MRATGFTVRIRPNAGRFVVAPLDGPRPIPESAWIPISEEGPEDWAVWSPDGNTLYFNSDRDGHACLGGFSAGAGQFAIALVENAGNIWLMSRPNAR